MCPPRLHKEICKNASFDPKNQRKINNSEMGHVLILVYPTKKLNTLIKKGIFFY
jgi:hypothetical protein